ncbi:hypothetical protein NKG60_08985 [Mesorhizobium sp. M1428]|uniref:hypothetical protein n=1 Tax=Mesorhizobium sp. M1428 TaxID=2957102 RepID=UPI003335D802
MSAIVLRMGDLNRWSPVKSGQAINLDGRKTRTVRLDLRASDAADWMVEWVNKDGVVTTEFLCLTPAGNSTIELLASEEMRLVPLFPKDASMHFSSSEFDFIHVEGDPESFTKIAHRRERNPEVEYMNFMMQQNIDARMRDMDAEIERRIAGITKGLTNGENASGEAGLHKRTPAQREKLPSAATGGQSPASADGLSGGVEQSDPARPVGAAAPASAPDNGANGGGAAPGQ